MAAYRQGLQSEWAFKSRVYIGQIHGIDEVNGTIDVVTAGMREGQRCTIPLHALSINGAQSSWMRYMPRVNDFVKVAFGPDNRMEVLSMATWGEDGDPSNPENRSGSYTPTVGGYSALRKKAARGEEGLGDFIPLRSGEWDFRSSGGAYIRGDRFGHLKLAAGALTSLDLDKQRDESNSRVGLHVWGGAGTEMALGDVKRAITGPIPGQAAGVNKEWRVRVANDVVGGIRTTLFEAEAGHVVDSLGLVETHSGTSLPLRYRARYYDDTLIASSETLRVEVDNLGNTKITQSDLAPAGLDIDGSALGSLSTSFRATSVVSTESGKFDGGALTDITGGVVNLNGGRASASQSVVRGEALATYLQTQAFVLTALGPSSPIQIPPSIANGVLSANVKVS